MTSTSSPAIHAQHGASGTRMPSATRTCVATASIGFFSSVRPRLETRSAGPRIWREWIRGRNALRPPAALEAREQLVPPLAPEELLERALPVDEDQRPAARRGTLERLEDLVARPAAVRGRHVLVLDEDVLARRVDRAEDRVVHGRLALWRVPEPLVGVGRRRAVERAGDLDDVVAGVGRDRRERRGGGVAAARARAVARAGVLGGRALLGGQPVELVLPALVERLEDIRRRRPRQRVRGRRGSSAASGAPRSRAGSC